ncbi:MAG TPA: butyrate kinase [Terriglobales bacterium]|nr:butyrate kinase [Terriglobales bacterium]
MERIFVINPGSTSTKLAVFEDEKLVHEKSITYSGDVIAGFGSFEDQYEMRKRDILGYLGEIGLKPTDISAIAARGSGFGPMKAGAYAIDEKLEAACRSMVRHVSYLATVISYELIREFAIKGYIYDCQTAVTMEDYVRLSGVPQIERRAGGHVLNSRAAARKAAEEAGLRYEDNVYIVAHLGGGCSVSLHKNGQLIDVLGGDEGAFTPERAGRLPMRAFTKMCFSGKYSEAEVNKFFTGRGGLVAYLGTNDAREVERRVQAGDETAGTVFKAMAYQITKDIGALYAVAPEEVKGIVLTGGLAHSDTLMCPVIDRVKHLAPVYRYPGTFEMEALAYGVLRVLRGVEQVQVL